MSKVQPRPGQVVSSQDASDHGRDKLVALGLMTGGVAHDIRNVLCVIDASLRIVERVDVHGHRERAAIAGAREAIARGLVLTRELLAFARDEPPHARAGDVNAVLRGARHLIKCADGAHIVIEGSLKAGLPSCIFDEAQLKSALLNIVINAREAMPRGGVVSLCTFLISRAAASGPASFVCVRVADNGPGMSEHVRAQIFDPFFTTKGAAGVGLGLWQARTHLRLSGGDLIARSAPGEGAAFDILLPLVAGEETQPH